MIILTYIVRLVLILMSVPCAILLYLMAQDVKTWGNNEN
jgi:hypothetical protein